MARVPMSRSLPPLLQARCAEAAPQSALSGRFGSRAYSSTRLDARHYYPPAKTKESNAGVPRCRIARMGKALSPAVYGHRRVQSSVRERRMLVPATSTSPRRRAVPSWLVAATGVPRMSAVRRMGHDVPAACRMGHLAPARFIVGWCYSIPHLCAERRPTLRLAARPTRPERAAHPARPIRRRHGCPWRRPRPPRRARGCRRGACRPGRSS